MMTRREKDEVYQMFPGTRETEQGATELVPMIMSASQVKYLDPVFLPSLPIRNRPGMQEQTTLLQPPTSEDPPTVQHAVVISQSLWAISQSLSTFFLLLKATSSASQRFCSSTSSSKEPTPTQCPPASPWVYRPCTSLPGHSQHSHICLAASLARRESRAGLEVSNCHPQQREQTSQNTEEALCRTELGKASRNKVLSTNLFQAPCEGHIRPLI